jgi:general stress protein 26
VTDFNSGKEHEIESEHELGLVFIDATDKAYLSITAPAEVRRDHAKTAQIWTTADNIWWSGPDDPNACVLRVVPVTAELWDGPASPSVKLVQGWVSSPTTLAWRYDRLYLIFP